MFFPVSLTFLIFELERIFYPTPAHGLRWLRPPLRRELKYVGHRAMVQVYHPPVRADRSSDLLLVLRAGGAPFPSINSPGSLVFQTRRSGTRLAWPDVSSSSSSSSGGGGRRRTRGSAHTCSSWWSLSGNTSKRRRVFAHKYTIGFGLNGNW